MGDYTTTMGMPATAVLNKCSQDIAEAMGETYSTVGGRRTRVLHPATYQRQGVLCTVWDDLRTAPRSHMFLSFQQHRRKLVGECREVDTARMSWNDLHPKEEPIQISFDFTNDLADLGAVRRRQLSYAFYAIELEQRDLLPQFFAQASDSPIAFYHLFCRLVVLIRQLPNFVYPRRDPQSVPWQCLRRAWRGQSGHVVVSCGFRP
jgi:hypothetical protein